MQLSVLAENTPVSVEKHPRFGKENPLLPVPIISYFWGVVCFF